MFSRPEPCPVPFSLRGGSIVALPTPFRGGTVDERALARLCDRQIAAGTSAVVVCATTGEGPALTDGEHRRVIEVAVEAAAEQIPIVAGAGTCNTAHSIVLARQAEQAGAAALLCVTPYYVRPTQDGIALHMRMIHEAVRIPIILYDVPARTGCGLADETVKRLAMLERVIGLKDATGDVTRPARLRPSVRDGFLLLSGDDATQAEYRRAGGDGCISVTANIVPRLCAQLHSAWDRGEVEVFERISAVLAPLNRALFLEANPIPVKHALNKMGLVAEELRLPLTQLSAEHDGPLQAVVDGALAEEKSAPHLMFAPIQLTAAGIMAMSRDYRA